MIVVIATRLQSSLHNCIHERHLRDDPYGMSKTKAPGTNSKHLSAGYVP